jgi:hypothetical protein
VTHHFHGSSVPPEYILPAPLPVGNAGPFTVPELVRMGVPMDEACLIVWDVGPDRIGSFLADRV